MFLNKCFGQCDVFLHLFMMIYLFYFLDLWKYNVFKEFFFFVLISMIFLVK